MSRVTQRQILNIIVFLIMAALLLFNRNLLTHLAQQSYIIIIPLLLVFIFLAIRNQSSIPEPVYSSRDQFSTTINTPNISQSLLKYEIHKWIKAKRVFGIIYILHEDENSIQIKSPTRFVSSTRWYPNFVMIYYITFIFKENEVEVDAEVEYPQYDNFFSSQVKLPYPFGILRCRDFIFSFFKQLDISIDMLYRDLYLKSELETYFKWEYGKVLRILLIILGVFILISLLAFVNEDISEPLYIVISNGIVFGVFGALLFGIYRLYSRNYRHILNHYLKDEDSITYN